MHPHCQGNRDIHDHASYAKNLTKEFGSSAQQEVPQQYMVYM